MLTVTKQFEFAYAHNLPFYHGKCKNLHGHTGILEIELRNTDKLHQLLIDEGAQYDSMIIDFSFLKKIVNDHVITFLDHNNLNTIMKEPTAENMVMWVMYKLQRFFPDSIMRIRIYETPTSFAEWKEPIRNCFSERVGKKNVQSCIHCPDGDK